MAMHGAGGAGAAVLLAGLLVSAGCGPSGARSGAEENTPRRVRVATFNVEELSAAKIEAGDPQVVAAAEVVRRVRPDVLVLNEIDFPYGPGGEPAPDAERVVRDFASRWLEVGDGAVVYPHVFVAPTNTGVLTGVDMNGDGAAATAADEGERSHGDDAFGFGVYPGQYGMAVLSRHPLDAEGARTFQLLRWRDLPGHHMPPGFYSDTARALARLSSKSHWDVPVLLGPDTLHLWVSHPTPPVFDGPEDRNGRRNYDEIGFWIRYLDGAPALRDDRGLGGGFGRQAPFLIAGDLNADPSGGEAALDGRAAIAQLLEDPRIQDPEPLQGVPTASFGGGLRVDYLLPSAGLTVLDGGVWAPDPASEPDAAAAASAASDHRLVWLDLAWPPGGAGGR